MRRAEGLISERKTSIGDSGVLFHETVNLSYNTVLLQILLTFKVQRLYLNLPPGLFFKHAA